MGGVQNMQTNTMYIVHLVALLNVQDGSQSEDLATFHKLTILLFHNTVSCKSDNPLIPAEMM